MKKQYVLILIIIIVFGVLVFVAPRYIKDNESRITDFDSCAEAGGAILESYPERCLTKGGQSFTRDIGNELEKTDKIQLVSPRPGERVVSPLLIKGEARGMWFFEASFPVKLLDSTGVVIAQGIATAKDEWMTENFVPFETILSFEKPRTATGTLILQRDNPSGLPEHDDALVIPLKF